MATKNTKRHKMERHKSKSVGINFSSLFFSCLFVFFVAIPSEAFL
jgi:hypothetical protein